MKASARLFAWHVFLGIWTIFTNGAIGCCPFMALVDSSLTGSEVTEQDSDPTLPMTSTPEAMTTSIPIVTVQPPKVRYKLELTNPGPSVLDSTLMFVAELKTESGEDIPQGMNFSYLWMNMADLEPVRTDDEQKATLRITFPSEKISPGDYTMTVVASEESNPSKILAFQTKKFVLTEKLNGHLHLQQALDYQRLSNTFSTGRQFTANAVVLDQFGAEQEPKFSFFWYEGGHFLITTSNPYLVTTVDSAGNFSMRTRIVASMAVGSGVKSELNLWERLFDPTTHDAGSKPAIANEVKNGDFAQQLYFKDPLTDCYIDRVDANPSDRDVKIGGAALVNITCTGSTPTAVCVNITTSNFTALTSNGTCEPGQFVDSVHHQVSVKLNTTGWNDVHFYVFNDVTRREYTIAYYAYDPDSSNIPELVLPIVFVFLGFFVVACGAVYIMRLRKKPQVEVADFDFHPSLNESSPGGTSSLRFSLVANTIKYLLSRRMRFRSGKHARSSTQGRSLENSGSSLMSTDGSALYDSL